MFISQLRNIGRVATLAGMAALAACADNKGTDLLAPSGAALSVGKAANDVGAVFVSTNDVNGNAVAAFNRAADGSLTALGTFPTGGAGVGGTTDPLASQFALVLSPDHKFLFVANAGSNDVSVFRVKKDGLKLVDRASSLGTRPVSVAATNGVIYVLNTSSNNLGIFHYGESGNLSASATASLSTAASGGAEVRVSPDGHFLNVTERVSNTIDSFVIGNDGALGAPINSASSGQTPFGFDYAPNGLLVVSEAGSAAASSYSQAGNGILTTVSKSVSTGGQAAPCWLIVDPAGRFAYTANAGGSSISGFAIANDGTLTLITAGGRTGDLGSGAQPLDLDITPDGRFLYVLKNGTGTVGTFTVASDGTLSALADTPGLGAHAGFMGLVAF
jgi:6-phosphogluconolactonase (cycloisomerase 2 family)